MDPRLGPIAHQYRMNTRFFRNALDGVPDEAGLTRPNADTNSMTFIAVHLVGARAYTAKVAGGDGTDPFEAYVGKARSIEDIERLPTLDEVRAAWPLVTDRVMERLEALETTELDVPQASPFPVEDRTLLGVLGFLALHDTYHVGQLGLLRKQLGYGAMSFR